MEMGRWTREGPIRTLCRNRGAVVVSGPLLYMGYYAGNDATARHQAVDMFGNGVDSWWVFRDGAWVLDET